MVQAAADMYCKPLVNFESKRWVVEGKTVLEVTIPKGTDIPYFANSEPNRWLAYIRVKDENILATNVHLKVWRNKTHDKGILIEYSEKIKKLMQYLEINPSISVSRFCIGCSPLWAQGMGPVDHCARWSAVFWDGSLLPSTAGRRPTGRPHLPQRDRSMDENQRGAQP